MALIALVPVSAFTDNPIVVVLQNPNDPLAVLLEDNPMTGWPTVALITTDPSEESVAPEPSTDFTMVTCAPALVTANSPRASTSAP